MKYVFVITPTSCIDLCFALFQFLAFGFISHNIKTRNTVRLIFVFRDKLSVPDQLRVPNAHLFSFSNGCDLIHSRDRS